MPVIVFRGRETDPYIIAKARAMLRGWWERNSARLVAKYQVVEVENEFTFPLQNPETESFSRTFVEAGKIDGILIDRASGREVVMEHKTSSEDITTGSEYWARLKMDVQVSKYFLSRMAAGKEPACVLYDVLKTPAFRPSQIPILDEDGIKVVCDKITGERLQNKNGSWKQSVSDSETQVMDCRIESPEEYEQRVFTEVTTRADEFYAWSEVPRLDGDLVEYMGDSWATSQEILMRRRMGIWPRNPAACLTFGRCEYFGICTGQDRVDGIHFQTTDRKHAELETQSAAGLELLTKSRVSCLRTCARKHKLHYEDGVKSTEPDSEALRLGTLVHEGLEQLLIHLKNNEA